MTYKNRIVQMHSLLHFILHHLSCVCVGTCVQKCTNTFSSWIAMLKKIQAICFLRVLWKC